MAPRKKKTAPAVVGTVSTRSTRRESIINVEIVPRSSKTPKRQTKKVKQMNSPGGLEEVVLKEPEAMEARPEIMELLREWSDDENSQNRNIDKIEQIEISDSPVNSLPDDQQSLIDILEGKQSDEDNNVQVKKVMAVDNPIVIIDSPKVEELDIIEECVVEDDSFIIEFADQTTSSSVETEVVQCVKSPKNQEEEDNSVNSITYTLEIEKVEEIPSSSMEVEEEVKFTQHEPEVKPQCSETVLKVKPTVECSQVTGAAESMVFDQLKRESDQVQIDEIPLCDNLEDKMSQISLKNDSNNQQDNITTINTPEKLSVIQSPIIKKYNTFEESRKSPKGSPRASPKCQVKRVISSDFEALPHSDSCKVASEITTAKEKEVIDSGSSENMETDPILNENSTKDPNSQTVQFPPRETKLAECWIIKRPSRKTVFTRTCSTKLKLIDDTIDEVLRMYTSDDESADMKKSQEITKSGTPSTSQESAGNKDTATFMEKLQERVADTLVLEDKSQSKMSFNKKGVSSAVPKTKVSRLFLINVAFIVTINLNVIG